MSRVLFHPYVYLLVPPFLYLFHQYSIVRALVVVSALFVILLHTEKKHVLSSSYMKIFKHGTTIWLISQRHKKNKQQFYLYRNIILLTSYNLTSYVPLLGTDKDFS